MPNAIMRKRFVGWFPPWRSSPDIKLRWVNPTIVGPAPGRCDLLPVRDGAHRSKILKTAPKVRQVQFLFHLDFGDLSLPLFKGRNSVIDKGFQSSENLNSGIPEMGKEAAVFFFCLLPQPARAAEWTTTALMFHAVFSLLLLFGFAHWSLQNRSKDSLPQV